MKTAGTKYGDGGKLDRRALASLPSPLLLRCSLRSPLRPSRSRARAALLQRPRTLLALPPRRLLLLGGHSSAPLDSSRASAPHSASNFLSSFFSSPSVASLARQVANLQNGAQQLPPPVRRTGDGLVPLLSAAQERLWFIQQLQPDSSAYHIPEAALLEGTLDVDALESALRWLVSRHAVLRLAIPSDDGRPAPILRDAPARADQGDAVRHRRRRWKNGCASKPNAPSPWRRARSTDSTCGSSHPIDMRCCSCSITCWWMSWRSPC